MLLLLLAFIPVIPKVMVTAVSGTGLVLDDVITSGLVIMGVVGFLARGAVRGVCRITLSGTGILLIGIAFYKCINLGLLSLFYPWVGLDGVGKGVLVNEGILVIGKTILLCVMYLLVYNISHNIRSVKSVIIFNLVAMGIVVGVGLVQFFLLEHGVLTSTFRNIYAMEKYSDALGVKDPWLDPSAIGHEHLGAYMVFNASMLAGMLLCGWPIRKKPRYLMVILLVGCLFCLVVASSRGAWIGGLGSLSALLLIASRLGKTRRVIWAAVLLVLCIYLVTWSSGLDLFKYIGDRVNTLGGILHGQIEDDSAKNRIYQLKGYWDMFAQSFLMGWGAGGAGRIAEGQFSRELIEGGILGGALFMLLILKSGQPAIRSVRLSRDPLIRGINVGFICGLVGLSCQSLFTELFIVTKVGIPFWMIAAVVHRINTDRNFGKDPRDVI